MIEVVDHVGELELRITAASPEVVYSEAIGALAAEISERAEERGQERRPIDLRAPGRDALLVDLLNEAIYLLDTGAFVATGLELEECSDHALRGELTGLVDPDARPLAKAATLHRLSFVPEGGSWHARVIVDV